MRCESCDSEGCTASIAGPPPPHCDDRKHFRGEAIGDRCGGPAHDDGDGDRTATMIVVDRPARCACACLVLGRMRAIAGQAAMTRREGSPTGWPLHWPRAADSRTTADFGSSREWRAPRRPFILRRSPRDSGTLTEFAAGSWAGARRYLGSALVHVGG
ncbi:hypothetical protein OBBRIDRAFT_608984 [Obba rivulosa]|uniref:Uncharacterized protein n=1 Tax=Obba rivulosa TaxID=1052685 RepID=A0A8E2AXT9_9APHY|nr:hypothetical protein OBBRIDRAFT_608984 [Obba rivulosa]